MVTITVICSNAVTQAVIPNVKVYLERDWGAGQWRQVQTKYTDSNGVAFFDEGYVATIPVNYRAQSYHPSYSNQISVSVLVYLGNQDAQIGMFLAPVPSGSPPPVDPGVTQPGGDIFGDITKMLPLILMIVLLTSVMGLTRR